MADSLHIVCPHCHTTNRVRRADLANAPRGVVKLPQVVESAVPLLGITAKPPRVLRKGETR